MELKETIDYAKKLAKSKTIVVNTIILLGIIAQLLTSVELPIDKDLQAIAILAVNYVLRIMTKEPIERKVL